ncbi:MAG TPA: hypothetical protein VL261_13395 [Nitrospira sp.]|jgi:hypothetical protein|nr:hypothetical protein [Nitrospira sp.]
MTRSDDPSIRPVSDGAFFTAEETALLTEAAFFHKKARITEKIRAQLEASRQVLKEEVREVDLLHLPDSDLSSTQLVKGEHLESFPYQYLDCPKHFHGSEKRTFRTLVWWGHHVAWAWILEGSLMRQYKKRLVDRFHAIAGRQLELSLAPTLWEWKQGEGFTLPITHDRKPQIAAVLAERSMLKIIRFLSLAEPRVQSGALPELSREAFRAMLPIVAL